LHNKIPEEANNLLTETNPIHFFPLRTDSARNPSSLDKNTLEGFMDCISELSLSTEMFV